MTKWNLHLTLWHKEEFQSAFNGQPLFDGDAKLIDSGGIRTYSWKLRTHFTSVCAINRIKL